jgi:hypothetical protein
VPPHLKVPGGVVSPQEKTQGPAVEVLYAKPYPLSVTEAESQNVPERAAMSYQSETPFDNIESTLEYVNQLLVATQEAQDQIETEIVRAADPQLARRKQALQLVNYKLDKLSSHITASRLILNDLRTLRRLLLEERKTPDPSAIA